MQPHAKDLPVEEKVALFSRTAWANVFNEEELNTICNNMHMAAALEGEIIFRQGERDFYMAVLVNGLVEISRKNSAGSDRAIVTLHPGSPFGEMSLIDNQPRSASAVALKDSTFLMLPQDKFTDLVYDDPQLGLKMVRNIARLISLRLRQMDDILIDCLG